MNDHTGRRTQAVQNKRYAAEDPESDEINGYSKIDQYDPVRITRMAEQVRGLLTELGEDPGREGLVKTPERVAKALQFLTHGYGLEPAEILRSAMFREEYQQMVIVRDIDTLSDLLDEEPGF